MKDKRKQSAVMLLIFFAITGLIIWLNPFYRITSLKIKDIEIIDLGAAIVFGDFLSLSAPFLAGYLVSLASSKLIKADKKTYWITMAICSSIVILVLTYLILTFGFDSDIWGIDMRMRHLK